jgi:hypothetical protein
VTSRRRKSQSQYRTTVPPVRKAKTTAAPTAAIPTNPSRIGHHTQSRPAYMYEARYTLDTSPLRRSYRQRCPALGHSFVMEDNAHHIRHCSNAMKQRRHSRYEKPPAPVPETITRTYSCGHLRKLRRSRACPRRHLCRTHDLRKRDIPPSHVHRAQTTKRCLPHLAHFGY